MCVLVFARFAFVCLSAPCAHSTRTHAHAPAHQINYVCDIGVGATYTIFAIPDEGEARVLCTFTAPNISYMHSFALTENYFVLQVRSSLSLGSHSRFAFGRNSAVIVSNGRLQAWPLYFNAPRLLWHKAVLEAMSWHGEDNAMY